VYAGYLGRFLSIDPAFESMMVAEPQSWNRYIYVLNNPLLLIDPNGELWIVAEGGKPQWVDKCPEKTICFTALALEHKNGGVIVFGSKNAEDITNYVANEDGMVDLNDLAKHHDANFIIAKDQAIPEEYLNGNAAAHLFTAAALYKVYYPNDLKLEFTAGSEKDGTPCTQANGRACHSGHFGNDIDIRYMDKHGNPIRKDSQAYKNADIGRTKFLILYFQGAGFDEIYTGNQALFGLPDGTPNVQTKNEKVHGNHLHVGKTENSYHNKKNPNRKKL
jgi:hypothetical protein